MLRPLASALRCRWTSRRRSARYERGVLLGVPPSRGPGVEVRRPSAAELASPTGCCSSSLEHPRHGALEERAVVAHHDHAAPGSDVDEGLEALEPVEVEVVGGLVEQEHVEAAEQDGGERCPGRLAARERGDRAVQPVLGAVRGRPPRAAARASRSGPPSGEVGARARRCRHRSRSRRRPGAQGGAPRSSSALAAATPGAAGQEGEQRLVGRGRAPGAGSPTWSDGGVRVTVPRSGWSMPASRRSSVVLPTPFGPTTPRRVRGPTAASTRVEHGERPVGAQRGHGRRARRRTTGRSWRTAYGIPRVANGRRAEWDRPATWRSR